MRDRKQKKILEAAERWAGAELSRRQVAVLSGDGSPDNGVAAGRLYVISEFAPGTSGQPVRDALYKWPEKYPDYADDFRKGWLQGVFEISAQLEPAGLIPKAPDMPPGWMTDLEGRHQQRYFDGENWTDRVRDDGVESVNPHAGPTG